MPRPHFTWQLRTRTLPLGDRTLLMAILNVTPDSFSDGGHFLAPHSALDQALRLLDQGADILDLGGESTRPGATQVTEKEEQSRILPVLDAILKARPDAIVSIDTYHAGTARLAVAAGAEIVNDVSGLTWDPKMPATLAESAPGAILMHTRGTPRDWSTQPPLAPDAILPTVLAGLKASLQTALAAGLPPDQIVLDPGFGFGKRGPENFTLLAQLHHLQQLGRPILIGLSRKRFLGPDPHATTAAHTIAVLAAAHILRVHDIPAARAAATVADSLLAQKSPPPPNA
jgi:dihydropteroate synthase